MPPKPRAKKRRVEVDVAEAEVEVLVIESSPEPVPVPVPGGAIRVARAATMARNKTTTMTTTTTTGHAGGKKTRRVHPAPANAAASSSRLSANGTGAREVIEIPDSSSEDEAGQNQQRAKQKQIQIQMQMGRGRRVTRSVSRAGSVGVVGGEDGLPSRDRSKGKGKAREKGKAKAVGQLVTIPDEEPVRGGTNGVDGKGDAKRKLPLFLAGETDSGSDDLREVDKQLSVGVLNGADAPREGAGAGVVQLPVGVDVVVADANADDQREEQQRMQERGEEEDFDADAFLGDDFYASDDGLGGQQLERNAGARVGHDVVPQVVQDAQSQPPVRPHSPPLEPERDEGELQREREEGREEGRRTSTAEMVEPARRASPPLDLFEATHLQVLEIIPDVCPVHLGALLAEQFPEVVRRQLGLGLGGGGGEDGVGELGGFGVGGEGRDEDEDEVMFGGDDVLYGGDEAMFVGDERVHPEGDWPVDREKERESVVRMVEVIVQHLFENPDYPRVDRKGKRKAEEAGVGEGSSKRVKDGGGGGGSSTGSSGTVDANPLNPDLTANNSDANGDAGDQGKLLYLSPDRPAITRTSYAQNVIHQLQIDFPRVPVGYLRGVVGERGGFYAPCWVWLEERERGYGSVGGDAGAGDVDGNAGEGVNGNGGEGVDGDGEPREPRPYVPKKDRKGKGRERVPRKDGEFEAEKAWLRAWVRARDEGELVGDGGSNPDALDLVAYDNTNAGKSGQDQQGQDEEPKDTECQCCFEMCAFGGMCQCPEGHLFCTDCLRAHAGTQLGSLNAKICCMSPEGYGPGGCGLPFPPSQLRLHLPVKLYALYERCGQQQQLREAREAGILDDLEECPFCDWACEIPKERGWEVDRLFSCGNVEVCGVVSCRKCKRKEHVPKSCEEMDEDKHLDHRKLIEEAMTKALMRECPKCGKAFIKESGCNKMTCGQCRTMSCYVCRQVISNGYQHFHNNQPGMPLATSSKDAKCPLWDSVDHRHDEEVNRAYKEAVEQVKKDNPEVKIGEDIKVDLPAPPPAVQPNQLPAGYLAPEMLVGGLAGRLAHIGAGAGFVGAPAEVVPARFEIGELERRVRADEAAVARDERSAADLRRVLGNVRMGEREAQNRYAELKRLKSQLKADGGGGGRTAESGELKRGVQKGMDAAQVDARRYAIERVGLEDRVEGFERSVGVLGVRIREAREMIAERRAGLERWRRERVLERAEAELELERVEHDRRAAIDRERMMLMRALENEEDIWERRRVDREAAVAARERLQRARRNAGAVNKRKKR